MCHMKFNKPKCNTQESGFTLVEMILTVVIGAIIMTMGVPSFSAFIKNNSLTTQVNDFVTTVNLSRTEAVKRRTRITICKSTTGTSCATSSYGWKDGWIAFVDADEDNTVDAGEDIISVKSAMPSGTTTDANGELTSDSDAVTNVSFYFTGNGRSSVAAGETGEILLCDSRNDKSKGKLIYLQPIGRVETISGPDGSDTSLTC